METQIRENIQNPEKLEEIYRSNKTKFRKIFLSLDHADLSSPLIEFWKIRLHQNLEKQSKIKQVSVSILLIICTALSLLMKLPKLLDFNLSSYPFYERNTAIFIFSALIFLTLKNKIKVNTRHLLYTVITILVCTLFVNLLPSFSNSDTIKLVYFHLPLLLWSLFGLVFIDFDFNNTSKRILFIKHNGDLFILTSLILLIGIILSIVTWGLFSAIDIEIIDFYLDNIVVSGLVSAPVVAYYLIQKFPTLTERIANIIARVFSPLILITLVVYLVSIIATKKNPYSDRDFLIVFNILLLGVMSIIFFTVTEERKKKSKFEILILFLLTLVTILIDFIALSAITYRLFEFGPTPNRIAVFGINVLILGNLFLILINLNNVIHKKGELKQVENTIAKYLSIYSLWTYFVVLFLPLIFKFK